MISGDFLFLVAILSQRSVAVDFVLYPILDFFFKFQLKIVNLNENFYIFILKHWYNIENIIILKK